MMKSVPKNLYAQTLMAVVVMLGLYFMWSFAREVVQGQQLANQVELERRQNAQLAADNRQLERDKAYYESDEYVRLRARTDLAIIGGQLRVLAALQFDLIGKLLPLHHLAGEA